MPFLLLLLLLTLSSLPFIGLSPLLLVPSHQHLALDLGVEVVPYRDRAL